MSFWKSLFGKPQTTLSPSVVETAFSLGDNLATLQYVLSQGADSQKSRQLQTAFTESIRRDAAKLNVQVPPEYLNSAADPRVEGLSQRIAAKHSKVVAVFFKFSYQARLAARLADMLVKGGPAVSFSAGMIGLNLELCVSEAVFAAKEVRTDDEHLFKSTEGLKLIDDAVREGEAIAVKVRNVVQAGIEGQTQELMTIAERLHKWWTNFSTGVPLELRMRKP